MAVVVGADEKFGYMAEVMGTDEEFGYMAEVGREWIGVKLMMHLLKRSLLPLFSLAKDVNGVLQLCKPCSLTVYMLPPGFDALGRCLSPYDGFLFLMEPLDLLLDFEQLLLFNNLVSEVFFLLVLQLDLFELRISLNDLYWRGCPWG
jgi:hypothetical protein